MTLKYIEFEPEELLEAASIDKEKSAGDMKLGKAWAWVDELTEVHGAGDVVIEDIEVAKVGSFDKVSWEVGTKDKGFGDKGVGTKDKEFGDKGVGTRDKEFGDKGVWQEESRGRGSRYMGFWDMGRWDKVESKEE